VQNEILLNSVYIDPGATAMDDVDGDISDAVVVDTSALDTSEVGVYRIEYRVRDSAGCEVRADRFVRVIALVPTSNLTQLTGLCSSNIPRVRELCGAVAASDANAPNPAAFPGCCIALSDMDEAGCFCVPEVIAGFEGESPSVAQLAAFTPLACGFRIKVGAVCEDQQLLSQFLSTPTAVPELVIPEDVWKTIVDEDGVLREDIGCNDTLTVVRKYCRAVTTNAGFAPRVADFAPCCAAATRLYNNTCLCDEPELITDENFVFVRELAGFTPLGCGFNYTDECPALVDRLGLKIVEIPTPGDVRTIPISTPTLSPFRPLEGYGVVVENGVPVPEGAPGLSACDPIRMLRNFLVVGFQPGSTSYDVLGAISCCANATVKIPEVTGVVGYRPRGAINTFVDAPSVPNVTCRGLSIISASGETLDDALCDRTTVEATSEGVSFTLRDIELCPNCAITGSRDGVLFTVQHASDATLNTLSPVVRALQCDTSGTWARATERPIGGDGTRRRRLLQQFFGGVPFFPMQQNTSSGAFAPPLIGFNLTQYAQPSTRRDFDGYFDPTGDDDPTGDFGGVACRTILPRVSSSLRWFGARANVSGPYQTAPFEDYTFTGSISLDSSDGQSATLTDVNVPVVLSAWVNDATTGEWRNVVDPLEEYRIECFPTRVARGSADAESQVASTPSADPCGGLRFFMSSYAPEGVFASNAGAMPQVTLLEITLSQVSLCAGCSLQGSNEDGALFKITSRTNARFDYVGPSVGNPTCVTDLRGRSVSPEGVDGETIPINPPPMLVDNTTGVECNGEKGLNLKGILLRDGSKFITDTEDECCMACAMTRDCDIWVYCTGDCVDFSYHSCWLKRSIGGGFTRERGPTDVAAWDRGPDVPWTSGWFVRDETTEPGPPPPPAAIPSVPDSATYFTLQPGVGVQIPASIITVIPGATVPGNETTSEPPSSPPPTTSGIFPPPPSNVAPTTPLPVPTPVPASPPSKPSPGPTPLPSGGDPARACVEGDALICPTESTPDALGLADVRLSVQLQSVSPLQAALTGTVINFGRVHARVCLAGVSVTIPFDKTVTNPSTNAQSVASASDFIVECVFVGVRTRDGPPSDDANGCGTYASAAVVDAGIELTFQNVALCKECWIVGGPAGVLFTIRHRDDWLLTLPEATLVNQNTFTESAATCAPVR